MQFTKTDTTIPASSIPVASHQCFSAESERSIICAALTEIREEVLREISGVLLSTDFFEEVHQNLWLIRTSLADAGVAHDVVAVLDSAKKRGLFVGGPDYLLELVDTEALKAMSDGALRAAAKRIKDYSMLRYLGESLEAGRTLAVGGMHTHAEVADYVSDVIESIRRSTQVASSGPVHVMNYVSSVADQVEQRLAGEEPKNTVTTGFEQYDNLTGGMADGDYWVLAGRPSMGKTALALAIQENAAATETHHVLMFSTEQGGTALATRMIASSARIDATKIKRADMSDDEFERMIEGCTRVGALNFHIDETSEITLPEIRARSRIFARKYGKVLIVVDYLQRISPHRQAEPRIIYGEISTGLKNLAKELKCPVVALAQLSRELEKRTNKRPMMSDLAESGKIEQDADIITFIYRDDYYNPDTKEPGVTELIVAKNRDGAVGVAKLGFNRATQRFDELHYPQ